MGSIVSWEDESFGYREGSGVAKGEVVGPEERPCDGCGALFPDTGGPAHRYFGASPGCWAVYGDVLAREYGDYSRYAPVHRLTVDAYAAQHPGVPSAQSIRSVAVHLIRLHLQLECGLPHEKANDAMLRISARSGNFPRLDPPPSPGPVTVLDVRDAKDPPEHVARVRDWARSVWEAWSAHHDTVRRWAED